MGIKYGGAAFANEISAHQLVFGVAQDAGHGTHGGGLHGGLDLVIAGRCGQIHGQVHHRHIRSGHPEGHAGELAVELGNNPAHGPGRTGGTGDDVLGCAAAAAPVLHRRAIDGFLGGSGGVHRGHQATDDAEVVMHHLGHRRQAVGGAAGVGNHVLAGIAAVVDAHHKHRRVVLGGGTHHHPPGTGVDVGAGGGVGKEEAGALEHVVGPHIAPVEVVGVPFGTDPDRAAIDHQLVVLHPHIPLEAAVAGVVAEHVGEVVAINQVVDTHHLHIRQRDRPAEGEPADAAETIDADADSHRGAPETLGRMVARHLTGPVSPGPASGTPGQTPETGRH